MTRRNEKVIDESQLLIVVRVHMSRMSRWSNGLCSERLPLSEVLLTIVVLVRLRTPVQRSPLGLLLEQAHGLDVLYLVSQPSIFRQTESNNRTKVLTFLSSVVKRW